MEVPDKKKLIGITLKASSNLRSLKLKAADSGTLLSDQLLFFTTFSIKTGLMNKPGKLKLALPLKAQNTQGGYGYRKTQIQ